MILLIICAVPEIRFGDSCEGGGICAGKNTDCRNSRCACREGYGRISDSGECGMAIYIVLMSVSCLKAWKYLESDNLSVSLY